MALAMWVAQPSRSCVLIEEPRRHLHLDRQLDREHLQRDGLKIRAAARRYASSLSSQSVDREITKCEETSLATWRPSMTCPSKTYTRQCPLSPDRRARGSAHYAGLTFSPLGPFMPCPTSKFTA